MKPRTNLVGEDGNIFAVLGRASRALDLAGRPDQAREMTSRVFAAGSYEQALGVVLEYVEEEQAPERCGVCGEPIRSDAGYRTEAVAEVWFPASPERESILVHEGCFDPDTMEVA